MENQTSKNFEIEGMSQHYVESLQDMVQTLQDADNQRHFAETYLDHLSSRSHMGFRIYLMHGGKSGNITFIDLAGCEKIRAYADKNTHQNIFGHDCSPVRQIK